VREALDSAYASHLVPDISVLELLSVMWSLETHGRLVRSSEWGGLDLKKNAQSRNRAFKEKWSIYEP